MKRFFVGISAILFCFGLLGCGSAPATNRPAPATAKGGHEEGHEHGDGPHGGTIMDWGGGAYHVEFTVDHDQQQATVYLLGSDEKTAEPIAAEKIQLLIDQPMTELDLVAQPLDGEKTGKSSRFVGKHANFAKEQEYSGTVSGVINGTPYTADFKEEPEAPAKK